MDAEPKNIIPGLVQVGYKPLRASNYPDSCIANRADNANL